MFIAGHETSASSLSWILHLLSMHQDVQDKLRAECKSALNGADPTLELIKQMPYLGQVIKEALRLYTPAAMQTTRGTKEDQEFEGIKIPKGVVIGIDFHVVHHLDEYWTEPEKFDPDRFSPENSRGRDPFAFVPFSVGPRACIGNHFATLEMSTILPMILVRYKVLPNGPVETTPHFMLNMPKAVNLFFKKIEA